MDALAATSLGIASAALAPGASAPFPIANWNDADDLWLRSYAGGSLLMACNTRWWHDVERGCCLLFVKGANGSEARVLQYEIATNTWSRVWGPSWPWADDAQMSTHLGHPWEVIAFDPATSSLFYRDFGAARVRSWRPDLGLGLTQGWPVYADPAYVGTVGTTPATVWHPNLFGPSIGGFVIHGRKAVQCYDPRGSGSTTILTTRLAAAGGPEVGLYIPGQDVVIVGGGNKAGGRFWRVSPGIKPTLTEIGSLATAVGGSPPRTDTGPHVPAQAYSRVILHPNERTALVLESLHPDYPNTHRVWQLNTATWQWELQTYLHPFAQAVAGQTESDAGYPTICTLPGLGILWALSYPGSHKLPPVSVIWRV
jgi:hypothetical protein